MQDIMTAPKSTFKTFEDYCHFFWNVKIAPSFRLSNCVGIIFDSQSRSVGPKDVTRAQRDATAKNECPVIKMGDETENEIDHNTPQFEGYNIEFEEELYDEFDEEGL